MREARPDEILPPRYSSSPGTRLNAAVSNPSSPILDAEETRERIDELGGLVPAYVLAEITEEVFVR